MTNIRWWLESGASKRSNTCGFLVRKLPAEVERFLRDTFPAYSSGTLTLWTLKRLNLKKIYVARISTGKNGQTLFRDLQIYVPDKLPLEEKIPPLLPKSPKKSPQP